MRAGKQRRFRLIQEALDQRGTYFRDVARALGISHTAVLKTAHGEANNRRVLRHLLGLGIDPALLDLPEDLRTEAQNIGAAAC
jgi:transcriptional regulator with XRE-family HTH domain